ncbi:methylthioribulose-1-phosphate dehydratase [Citrobacter koseri]|uniref:Methylthioribulose-1-phosphate dehydratase n=1 Tax=Citrobacter koseri TaxID=545 RepID=A0A447UJE4_CITKO|nr:methylthioribulose-1-phosphate dehydratase [Citrobacter koseri]
MTDNLQLTQLVETCRWIGAKGWAPATGGNMSVRQDDAFCWLSESGKDKGNLTTDDFLQVEIATSHAPSGRKPSAETGLHTLDLSPLSPGKRGVARPHRQRHGALAHR